MKRIGVWISDDRFCRMFEFLKLPDGFRFLFFVPHKSLLLDKKYSIEINRKDYRGVLAEIQKNGLETIVMSHVNIKFLEEFSGNKVYLSHGFFDHNSDTLSFSDYRYIKKFDKIIVPGDVSRDVLHTFFGVPEDKFVRGIHLPYDYIYGKTREKKIDVGIKNIVVIDHGAFMKKESMRQYSTRLTKLVEILSDFCKCNKNFQLSIKVKYVASEKIFKEKFGYWAKILSPFDYSYLNSDIMFIIRSPSSEMEMLNLDAKKIIVRDESEDYSGLIKFGAVVNIGMDNLNSFGVGLAIKMAEEMDRKKEQEFLEKLDVAKFDGKNGQRLIEFLRRNYG